MARIARVVVPGFVHHVTQRERAFFGEDDYRDYLELLRQDASAKEAGTETRNW
ncbi:hypothetical protein [Labrys miyagiensis]